MLWPRAQDKISCRLITKEWKRKGKMGPKIKRDMWNLLSSNHTHTFKYCIAY